jgi:hypothetical protein
MIYPLNSINDLEDFVNLQKLLEHSNTRIAHCTIIQELVNPFNEISFCDETAPKAPKALAQCTRFGCLVKLPVWVALRLASYEHYT